MRKRVPHTAEDENIGRMPERTLAAAVLERAIADAAGGWLVEARHTRDALLWLRSKSMRPFGFRWLCEHIGADADALLEGLEKRLRQYNGKPPRAIVLRAA